MNMRAIFLLFGSMAVSTAAQQIGQNSAPGATGTYTLSVRSQLVVETVVVKDGAGKFISGLTAKDFALTEDGTPQTIRFCEQQSLTTNSQPSPVSTPSDESIRIYRQLSRTEVAPETEGGEHYKNRRLLALYFDMSAMRPADQLRALAAAESFLRTRMTTADMIAILRYQGGSVDILQDFTTDRNRLLSILQTMMVGEGQGSAENIDDASSADTGPPLGRMTVSSISLIPIGNWRPSRRRLRCSVRWTRRSR